MSKFRLLPVCAGVVVAQLGAVSVSAQPAIEEVVVTARKKSESLQDVPLSITAFSGDQMERNDFVNLEDVASNTVGLNYSGESSAGYQSSPTLRGLRGGFAQDRVQNVAIFLDGIYLARQSMANMGMVDMERIEVVKGPQNSLYGRNAFAGAINYVTKKPTDEQEGYASVTVGEDNREDLKFSLSGPLIEGKLYGRASIGTSEFDGTIRNEHELSYVNPQGFTDGGPDQLLGGWEDKTYNLGLRWLPTDTIEINAGYFNTELKRENAPSFVLGGIREVSQFQTTPYDDMNYNPVTMLTNVADKAGGSFAGLTATGYTLWKGALPYQASKGTWAGSQQAVINDGKVTYIPGTESYNWGFGDGVVVPDQRKSGPNNDPRGFGFQADTEIFSLGFVWDFSEDWTFNYLAGYVKHDGVQKGAAARDAMFGTSLTDNCTDPVACDRADVEMQATVSTSRPIIEFENWSHEFRFDWAGNESYSASFGGYYASTEDKQYSQTTYNPICTTPERLYDDDQEDPVANCYVPFGESAGPLSEVPSQGVGIYNVFRDSWSGGEADKTTFDEKVYAIFGVVDYFITPDVTLRLEGRYTYEDKSIDRLSDTFALAPGDVGDPLGGAGDLVYSSICGDDAVELDDGTGRRVVPQTGDVCIEPYDEENFEYFTPKVNLEWQYSEDNMVYGYIAKGLKAGGFNNTSDPDQGTYDPEVNWTYEIGSKNKFLDGALTMNLSVYYVEWEDYVGSASPTLTTGALSQSPNAGSIQTNIGDVENYGFELEGKYYFNDNISFDYGMAYTNPKYDDGAKYAEAKTNFYYQCTPENLLTDTNPDGTPIGGNFDDIIDFGEACGNDDISGNELIKVSKEQYTWAMNYSDDFANGWSVNWRFDGNYQSKQWIDPLNLAYIKSRTLWNTSLNFQGPEHWEFNLAVKNVFDKEYVSGSFLIGIFNKHIVSMGSPRTVTATLKYSF